MMIVFDLQAGRVTEQAGLDDRLDEITVIDSNLSVFLMSNSHL